VEDRRKPAERAGPMRLKWPLRLCLFVAAIAVVYWLGTSLFSAARMKPLFYPLFSSLFHTNAEGPLFHYLSIVRWTAHYLEYFTLFLLLVWLLGLRPLTALVLCVVLAAADEGHQYFLPDRTCSLRDLSFDAVGAATAFVLTIAARRLRTATPPETRTVPERSGQASA
jgi:VanZ family protein